MLIWNKVSWLTSLPAIKAINSRMQYAFKYLNCSPLHSCEKLIRNFELIAWLLLLLYVLWLSFNGWNHHYYLIAFNLSTILIKIYVYALVHRLIPTTKFIQDKYRLSRPNYYYLIVNTFKWNSTKQFEWFLMISFNDCICIIRIRFEWHFILNLRFDWISCKKKKMNKEMRFADLRYLYLFVACIWRLFIG